MIDLYSDTQTLPTQAMLEAVSAAELGDSSMGSDPTVDYLERLSASRFGMERAMLVPTGTMANLCALYAHNVSALVTDQYAHVVRFESGGYARLLGIPFYPVASHAGVLVPADLQAQLLGLPRGHRERATICLENTHNYSGGTVTSPDTVAQVVSLAADHGARVHVDGARIFNAAAFLEIDVSELTNGCDSVMFSLSKGLAAPIGSVLVGSDDFIERAREARKLFGGAMRQAGVVAAAGIVAVEVMVERLAEDHRRARRLAEGISELPGVEVDMDTVQTNIVVCDIRALGVTAADFADRLFSAGVRVKLREPGLIRMVTHYHITSTDIEQSITAIAKVVEEVNHAL